MDKKRLGFALACMVLAASLAGLFHQLEDTLSPPTAITLGDIVTQDLPHGWWFVAAQEETPGSLSFYLLTDNDVTVVLEGNACKGLGAATSAADCLEREIEQHLHTRQLREATKITRHPASESGLDGASAFLEILDDRRSSFLLEVYRVESEGGPVFATVSLPENESDKSLHGITHFLKATVSRAKRGVSP